MARCIRCGGDTIRVGKRVCPTCMRKWLAARKAAYAQAETELGPVCAANHEAFVARVKALEHKAKQTEESH